MTASSRSAKKKPVAKKKTAMKKRTAVKTRAPVKKESRARIPPKVEIDEAQIVDPPPTALAAFDVQGLGEELAETFVATVTGADDAATDHREVITVAEKGGPFVLTTDATEFATGIDASNPADALREALPTVRTP